MIVGVEGSFLDLFRWSCLCVFCFCPFDYIRCCVLYVGLLSWIRIPVIEIESWLLSSLNLEFLLITYLAWGRVGSAGERSRLHLAPRTRAATATVNLALLNSTGPALSPSSAHL